MKKAKHWIFEKAVKYDPKNYYYNMALASLSKELGKNRDAVDIYRSLLKEYPSKIELYMQLSQAYADSGELQKAIDVLNELEKISGFRKLQLSINFSCIPCSTKRKSFYGD